jgi:hypothetical protein
MEKHMKVKELIRQLDRLVERNVDNAELQIIVETIGERTEIDRVMHETPLEVVNGMPREVIVIKGTSI